jgi:hypothetical protein
MGLALPCALPLQARDQVEGKTAAGSSISKSDIADATVIKTYEPEEFARLARQQHTCEAGTLLTSYAPNTEFVLDGVSYSPESFGKELVRRHGEEAFDCIEIAAACRSTMLVARLMMAVKSIDIEQINLHADERIFSDKNAKLPECPK